jgi:hypothetical protein
VFATIFPFKDFKIVAYHFIGCDWNFVSYLALYLTHTPLNVGRYRPHHDRGHHWRKCDIHFSSISATLLERNVDECIIDAISN